MEARYRSDYAGEFVLLQTRWADRRKQEQREWIPNHIENQHISGRAVCIGSGVDFEKFDYRILQRHRGGLLGSKKLQTYAVGSLSQQMRTDFIVESDKNSLQSIIHADYQKDNVVYTTARNCVNFPEQFYLIPYCPRMLDLALILYLAAFDGHKEIFMLGYNKDTPVASNDWKQQILEVIQAYSGTTFYMVGEPTNMPDVWVNEPNTKTFNYREFIGYCDV